MYLFKEKNLNTQEEAKILAEASTLSEIPFRLEDLGFKDCKTKIVDGTMFYYKGKRAMYVHYNR